MKKNISFLVLFLCFFVGLTTVDAASSCPNSTKKDLSRAANYVKASYEVIDKSEVKEVTVDGNTTNYRVPNYSFDISIYNLTENLYAEVTTSKNDGQRRVYYSDTKDGIYSFVDNNAGEIYNYIVTIKSDGDCSGLTLRTIKFTKPRYNAYSEYTYCQNSSNYYCQKFIGTEINIRSTSEFLNKIQVNNDKNNPTKNAGENENIISVVKKNWKLYLFIFFGVLVVSFIAVVIFMLFKRKKNKEWKL